MSTKRSTPDFDTRFARKSKQAVRPLRRRLLIVCGASRTEPLYLEGLNSRLRNPAVRIKVLTKSCAPLQVVEYGVQQAVAVSDSYDELWCVVDVDQFTDLEEAVRRAAECTSPPTTVVISNPCFELWLLLHFADHRAHVASYAQLRPLLRKHLPNYDKSRLDFVRDGYAGTHAVAAQRAMALEPTGTDFAVNPSTNMWRLVEAMKR